MKNPILLQHKKNIADQIRWLKTHLDALAEGAAESELWHERVTFLIAASHLGTAANELEKELGEKK